MSITFRRLAMLSGAVAMLALAACQTATPYQPQTSPGSTGYTDQRISENRYRVTFRGNSATHREIVENYLMLRAAEVTLQSGYQYFVFDTRDTEAKTSYHTDFMGWPGWRGHGWYWHNWDWDNSYDTYPITRYEAYAEIIMLTPDQAKNESRAMNAQQVLDHIGPSAYPPAPPPPSAH